MMPTTKTALSLPTNNSNPNQHPNQHLGQNQNSIQNEILTVQDLHVTFTSGKKSLQAVRGISFPLYKGEILGIVGESGCGKSVAAKALLKLLPEHASSVKGTVTFQGNDLISYSEKHMQHIRGKEIAMIFQDPMTSLNPTLKIGQQIVEGYLRHYPHISKEKASAYAVEMLERVGIPEPKSRVEQYPHLLSGGMRQRVMIALALASHPKILIADEPTTALDVTIQAQILQLMKEIQKDTDTSIILITHDLSVVAGYCDRVIVMYAGQIVESAEVHTLFSHPKHPYTQRLLQSIPRLDRCKSHPLAVLEGMPPNLSVPPKGCAFAARCHLAFAPCKEKNPPLFTVDHDHTCACFLHEGGS